ncbi:MAG: DUF447 domain-containing protein [Halolamina sp.]
MSDWPVPLDGIAETVTLTPDPDGGWNVAALGIHAGEPATARTWGETNTRRNLERSGRAVVTFADDPVLFVEAALTERHVESTAIDGVAARVDVVAEAIDRGTSGGTTWVDWALVPGDSEVVRRSVPVTNRGFNAIVEMTVAVSRLGVPAYDDETLRARLGYFEGVVETCGGEREADALERIHDLAEW